MRKGIVETILRVVTIVGAAAIAADTVNAFASAGVPPSPPPRARVGEEARAGDVEAAIAAIRARNVFLHGERDPDDPLPEAGAAAPGRCSAPLDLLGAVFVHGAPSLSLVTVRDRASARIDVFQVGEGISSSATLAAVLADDSDPGRLAAIELSFADGHRERCDAVPGAALVSGKDARPALLGGSKQVVGESEVRAVLADFTPLVSVMRAMPVDGGFKLFGIPADSLPAHAGLKNGDVVRRVNGYEIKSAQDALQLVAVLRNERDLSVDVVRDGSAQTLEVAIR